MNSANGMKAVAHELHISINELIEPEIETMEIREDQPMGWFFGSQLDYQAGLNSKKIRTVYPSKREKQTK